MSILKIEFNDKFEDKECWVYKFTYNKEPIAFALGTLEDLNEEQALRIGEKKKEEYICREIDNPTSCKYNPLLEEICHDYLENKKFKKDGNLLNEHTRKRYRTSVNSLLSKFKGFKLSEITRDLLEEYRKERLKQNSYRHGKKIQPSTVNNDINCLKDIYSFAEKERGYELKNDVEGLRDLIKDNRRDRVITREEQRKLLKHSPEHLRNIIYFNLYLPMRIGEIIKLKWEDINFEQKYLKIRAENNKSNKALTLNLDDDLIAFLRKIKEINDNEYVFLNSRGNPYKSTDSMKNCFINVKKKAGIKDLWLHDLRRCGATELSKNNVPTPIISKIMGHSSTETTERYIVVRQDDIANALSDLANNNKHLLDLM